MTKRLGIKFVPFICLLMWFSLGHSQAQEGTGTTQEQVQAQLSTGGWEVSWGRQLTQNEYANFFYIVRQATSLNDPNLIFSQYFDGFQNETTINNILSRNPQLTRPYLEQLILRAFNNNEQVIREGTIEISAGARSYQQYYPEGSTGYNPGKAFSCAERLPNGELRPKTCYTNATAPAATPAPRLTTQTFYLPYWRVRQVTEVIVPTPTPVPGQGIEGLYFHNPSTRPVWVAIGYYEPWSNQFVSRGWTKVESGETRRAYAGRLTNSVYAYYAKTDNNSQISAPGESLFWVRSQDWDNAPQSADLRPQGYEQRLFKNVNTYGNYAFTVELPATY